MTKRPGSTLRVDESVQPGEDLGRAQLTQVLAAQGGAKRRHEKRRGHALARDVGDRQRRRGRPRGQVVEVVAAHLARGQAQAGQLEPRDRRRPRGQQPLLDLARQRSSSSRRCRSSSIVRMRSRPSAIPLKGPATPHSSSSPSIGMRWARSPASSRPAPRPQRADRGRDAATQGPHHGEVRAGHHDQAATRAGRGGPGRGCSADSPGTPSKSPSATAPQRRSTSRQAVVPLPAPPAPADAVQQDRSRP